MCVSTTASITPACLLGLILATGCQSVGGRAQVAADSTRSFFARTFRGGSADPYSTQEEDTGDPDDMTTVDLAYAQWMEADGNLTKAREHYARVAGERPESIEAILGLARIDMMSGRTHEAEQGFRTALRIDPSSPQALHALGQFYAAQHRWSEAVETLNKAMLAAPTEKTYRHDLAVAMVHTGDVNGALPHFVRTVGDAEAHYNVGLILRETGRLRDAEEQMLLAVTKNPDLHQAQYWLDEIRREHETSIVADTPPQTELPLTRVSHQTAPQGSRPVPPTAPASRESSGSHSTANPASQWSPEEMSRPQWEQRRNQRPPLW